MALFQNTSCINRVPLVGLGTYAFEPHNNASVKSNQENKDDKQIVCSAEEIVYHAIGHANYRHIDTAHVYNNEKEIGNGILRAIKDFGLLRSDLFVCGKLWNEHHAPEDVGSALRNTLKNLRLDYLDLYLMHWPFAFKREHPHHFPKVVPKEKIDYLTELSPVKTWLAMEKLVEEGLVRNIGVSNFNSQQLLEIINEGKIRPIVNQVECHAYLSQEKLLKFCQKHGIQLVAYSPLGSPGRLWASPNETHLLNDPVLEGIKLKHNKTAAQILIRWQVQRGVVVIPATRNKVRCDENINIFDFSLDHDDLKIINGMNQNRRLYIPFVNGKAWCSDHPHYPFNIEY